MEYGKRILEELKSRNGSGKGFHLNANVGDNQVEVSADLSGVGPYGCLVNSVRCRSLAEKEGDGSIREKAESFTGRAGYLEEDLCLHECEEEQQVALIRSSSVESDQESIVYYEGRLDDSSIRLSRVRYSKQDQSRKEIPFALTQQALGRLVDDMASTLA